MSFTETTTYQLELETAPHKLLPIPPGLLKVILSVCVGLTAVFRYGVGCQVDPLQLISLIIFFWSWLKSDRNCIGKRSFLGSKNCLIRCLP